MARMFFFSLERNQNMLLSPLCNSSQVVHGGGSWEASCGWVKSMHYLARVHLTSLLGDRGLTLSWTLFPPIIPGLPLAWPSILNRPFQQNLLYPSGLMLNPQWSISQGRRGWEMTQWEGGLFLLQPLREDPFVLCLLQCDVSGVKLCKWSIKWIS